MNASLTTLDAVLAAARSEAARQGPFPTAVVHPCHEASLRGALEARAAGLIEPLVVAPRRKIEALASEFHLDIGDLRIIDVPHSHAAAETGAALARDGQAALIMKGSLHTDELMGAVLADEARLRTERRVSHAFVLEVPTYPKLLIVTDGAINIHPDLEAKADIVRNAIELAHALHVRRPKVAVLAAVETVSAKLPATVDAAALSKMNERGQITGALVDGPLAFDNAISADAARIKGLHSEVSGAADILVVPDLESGNLLAKQMEYLGHARSAGIVLGARVPIALNSRADPDEALLISCALAMLCRAHRAVE